MRPEQPRSFEAMGVTVEVGGADHGAFEQIRDLFAAREAVFSRFRSGSESRASTAARRLFSRLLPSSPAPSRWPSPLPSRPTDWSTRPLEWPRGSRLRPTFAASPGRAPARACSPRPVAGARHRQRSPLPRGGPAARPEWVVKGGRRRRGRPARRRRFRLGRRRPRDPRRMDVAARRRNRAPRGGGLATSGSSRRSWIRGGDRNTT